MSSFQRVTSTVWPVSSCPTALHTRPAFPYFDVKSLASAFSLRRSSSWSTGWFGFRSLMSIGGLKLGEGAPPDKGSVEMSGAREHLRVLARFGHATPARRIMGPRFPSRTVAGPSPRASLRLAASGASLCAAAALLAALRGVPCHGSDALLDFTSMALQL